MGVADCVPEVLTEEKNLRLHTEVKFYDGEEEDKYIVPAWHLAVLLLGHSMAMCRRENELRGLHVEDGSLGWCFRLGTVTWILPGSHQCIMRSIPILTQIQAVARHSGTCL